MNSGEVLPPPPTARMTKETFLGVLWASTAISFVFLIFRLAVRVKTFRRLLVDDYLVIFSWTILLVSAVLWQLQSGILYEQFGLGSGEVVPGPDFLERYQKFMYYIAPFTILFYTSLWSIKISFLVFFYKLGSTIRTHQIWGWVVAAITFASYVVCVADVQYECSFNNIQYIMMNCPSKKKVRFQYATFYVNCVLDVVTDLLIISIPSLILWKVQIPLKRKLMLLGIFSLTVVVMAVAIIRVAVNSDNTRNAAIDWLYFWSNIEAATAIVIACMASFRQLFVTSQNAHQYSRYRGEKPSGRSDAAADAASQDSTARLRSKASRVFRWRSGSSDVSREERTERHAVPAEVLCARCGATAALPRPAGGLP